MTAGYDYLDRHFKPKCNAYKYLILTVILKDFEYRSISLVTILIKL